MGFVEWVLPLIHFVISLKTAISHFLLGIGTKQLLFASYYKDQTHLVKDSKTLSKLPIHVGLLISENDLSYSDITNLCVWCIGMGISYVSLYDSNGTLKKNKSLIYKEITEHHRKTAGEKRSLLNIHVNAGVNTIEDNKECLQSPQANVYVLSPEDGKRHLVDVTKALCEQSMLQQRRASDITLTDVQTYIEENQGFPDPDLLIRFGSVDSLLGFLPWQIRLSEILHLPSHHNIDYKTFLRTMQGYANCNQRFGK